MKCRSPIAGSSALCSSFQDSRTVVLKSVLFLKSCSSNLDCPGGSDGKVSAYNAGDPGSIPLGKIPLEKEMANPLQYSCLENPMDGGVWWAIVRGVAKSLTQLSDFTFTFQLICG